MAIVSDAIPTEEQEQIKLVVWMEKNNIPFYHVPNQRRCNQRQGLKFKRLGVKAGIPDIVIPHPTKRYHGLYIELKRVKGGRVSQEQWEWINFLRSKGYCAEVCRGFLEARELISSYLDWPSLTSLNRDIYV